MWLSLKFSFDLKDVRRKINSVSRQTKDGDGCLLDHVDSYYLKFMENTEPVEAMQSVVGVMAKQLKALIAKQRPVLSS